MKKILLFIVALVATLSMNAQTTEIYKGAAKEASYLGADVTVKFGVDGDGKPTLEVYKGGELQKTYTGPEYKVVSTPVEETLKAVYYNGNGSNTLTFYYDQDKYKESYKEEDGYFVYENGTDKYLFDNAESGGAKWGYDGIRENVKKVVIDKSVKKYEDLTSTAYMFQGMTAASDISGAENLNVANVTDMNHMFSNFGAGTSDKPNDISIVPNVSEWNTGKVTDMSCLFDYYGFRSTSLTAVPDISKWNTENVTNMASVFSYYGYKSSGLKAFPKVSGWKTDKVTIMSNLFDNYGHDSKNIECELDLSGWNLAEVTGATNAFNFSPKAFSIMIPAKTGDKANKAGEWYYGDGTNSITPPTGKSFSMFGGYAAVKSEAGITGNQVKWIQLWAGGPKFAEYNVGVRDGKAYSYGGYYCWGMSIDQDDNGVYKKNIDILTGTDDTATNLWGANWRMPTNDELQGLIDNCDVVWTDDYNGFGKKGRIFKGRGDYAAYSIFLPAAKYCNMGNVQDPEGYGYYWSSKFYSGSYANCLTFKSDGNTLEGKFGGYGYSVRAVLNETTGTAKATIDGSEVDVNWVQLWAGGPKFAEYNVGASSATDIGSTMNFTDATKAGANYVWGANWCTPSKGDMEYLMTAAKGETDDKVKCKYIQEDGQWGFKFTGLTDGYTGNSVFFPAQGGTSVSGFADYWSATVFGSESWYMRLRYGYGSWDSRWESINQDKKFLVRPVFKN